MESLKNLEKIVVSSVKKGVEKGLLLLTAGALIGTGFLATREALAGIVPQCNPSKISTEFKKFEKNVSIGVSVFPTLVSVPSESGTIYSLGNTREIDASGMGSISIGENAGITISGKLSGFYSSNKIFSSDEEFGSAESAGGFVNASIGGIVKSKDTILFGNFGAGIYILNVLDSEYAGEKGVKQTENGLNWTGSLGLEYVTSDSTLTLSADGKGGFHINDGSLDLIGTQNYGINLIFVNDKDVSLKLRISGENEFGDQAPFSNTFYEGSVSTSLKNIADMFGKGSPDYLSDISLIVGGRGAFHSTGPVTKYAEGDKTSCISIGFDYKFNGGTFNATSEVSLDNPVKTDTGMPPAGITINYSYQGDEL